MEVVRRKAAAAFLLLLIIRRRRRQRKIKKRLWVRKIFYEDNRRIYSDFRNLIPEMRLTDRESYLRLVVYYRYDEKL